MANNLGKITQVIGPVVDVSFDIEKSALPPIYTALKVSRPGSTDLLLEVEQHIGEQTVRCVAMDATQSGLMLCSRIHASESFCASLSRAIPDVIISFQDFVA